MNAISMRWTGYGGDCPVITVGLNEMGSEDSDDAASAQ